MSLDRERLLKLLRLTESDADGEALNAVRMANRMLKSAGKSWDEVLIGVTTPSASARSYGSPDYRTPPSKRGPRTYGRAEPPKKRAEPKKIYDDNIGDYLKALTERRHDMGTVMFLASLTEFYQENGYLTEPQYEAIVRMHDAKPGQSRWRF